LVSEIGRVNEPLINCWPKVSKNKKAKKVQLIIFLPYSTPDVGTNYYLLIGGANNIVKKNEFAEF
jgi:hypothetical protein